MKKWSFIAIFLLSVCFTQAQNNVIYDLESGITELEEQYVKAWKNVQKVDGYRIQIAAFSGHNSKTQIESIMESFKKEFPDIPAYISFFEPYFRLRVGNFYTKLEAYYTLQKVSPRFEGSYIIRDKILLIEISEDAEGENEKNSPSDEFFIEE